MCIIHLVRASGKTGSVRWTSPALVGCIVQPPIIWLHLTRQRTVDCVSGAIIQCTRRSNDNKPTDRPTAVCVCYDRSLDWTGKLRCAVIGWLAFEKRRRLAPPCCCSERWQGSVTGRGGRGRLGPAGHATHSASQPARNAYLPMQRHQATSLSVWSIRPLAIHAICWGPTIRYDTMNYIYTRA